MGYKQEVFEPPLPLPPSYLALSPPPLPPPAHRSVKRGRPWGGWWRRGLPARSHPPRRRSTSYLKTPRMYKPQYCVRRNWLLLRCMRVWWVTWNAILWAGYCLFQRVLLQESGYVSCGNFTSLGHGWGDSNGKSLHLAKYGWISRTFVYLIEHLIIHIPCLIINIEYSFIVKFDSIIEVLCRRSSCRQSSTATWRPRYGSAVIFPPNVKASRLRRSLAAATVKL